MVEGAQAPVPRGTVRPGFGIDDPHFPLANILANILVLEKAEPSHRLHPSCVRIRVRVRVRVRIEC